MAKEQIIIRPHAGFQEKFVRTNVDVCFAGGVLNPQPVDSLVATPCGFVRIGDLKAGDIICDTKGGTQRVNFVLDKGMQPCVEFTLSDGRKVQSALSHNWYVKHRTGEYLELTAEQIIKYIDKEESFRHNRKVTTEKGCSYKYKRKFGHLYGIRKTDGNGHSRH